MSDAGAQLRAAAARAVDAVVSDGQSLTIALAHAEQKLKEKDLPPVQWCPPNARHSR